MRESSKKTIQWVKKILKDGETMYHIDESENYVINEAKAIRLLDKFEFVEKQLQKGGIIQDVNKKLCMHGDKIREVDGEMREGVLTWDNVPRCFCFDWDNFSEPLGERDFEKIEE